MQPVVSDRLDVVCDKNIETLGPVSPPFSHRPVRRVDRVSMIVSPEHALTCGATGLPSG
jgi:hypothetical protein